jgi:uncharacterized protein YceK
MIVMAKTIRAATLAMAMLLTMSGCGTMLGNLGLSLAHHNQMYGGVQCDLDACASNLKDLREPSEDKSRVEAALCGAMCVVDLPLSAIADTLTLPFTIKATLDGTACSVKPVDQKQEATPSDPVDQSRVTPVIPVAGK